MALKGDRNVIETDIFHACDVEAERGVIVVVGASGSGSALGATAGVATVNATASGVPLGVLMNDVESLDETKYRQDPYRDVMNVDEPVTVLRKGYVVTDQVSGTPTEGDDAYLGTNGAVATTGDILVGSFGGAKDADGYVKLHVNLP